MIWAVLVYHTPTAVLEAERTKHRVKGRNAASLGDLQWRAAENVLLQVRVGQHSGYIRGAKWKTVEFDRAELSVGPWYNNRQYPLLVKVSCWKRLIRNVPSD